MSKVYIGIDAGGTKTAYAISDIKGNILVKRETTTIHAKQVSEDKIKEIVFTTVESMLNEIGKTKEDIGYLFAGLPGFGEFPEVMELFNKLFTELLGNKNYRLGNDSVAGWAGSQAGKPGVNMVLGTGAIAYGMDYKGNEERSSGWGPFCGDEGSAYWLGRETIKLFGKQSDGRVEKSHLYDIIKEKYQQLVRRLLYLCHTRPDIAFVVCVVSRYMHEPRSGHLEAVHRILRYLKTCPGKD